MYKKSEGVIMKKIIALVLSVLLTFSVFAMPVGAATSKHVKCPIIYISGSSIDICDADGNIISTGFDVLLDENEGGMSKEDLIKFVVEVSVPFILEGMPKDKWDNYGKEIYDGLAPVWDKTQIDGDGNAKYGTGVSKDEIAYWDNEATKDKGADGYFGLREYDFRYDWRLSPYDHVDRLHEFIKQVRAATGSDQVCLVGRCIGGSVVTAYLEAYGECGYVKKVFYDETLSNGCAVISECFSGQIDFSDKHVQAYLLESEYFGKENVGIDLVGVNDLILEVTERIVDLLTQVGATDSMLIGVENLYNRLYSALIPSLLLATGMGTWVSYWTCVYEDDMKAALDLVFGEEGSETREQFAGLIDKILYVREHMTSQYPALYKTFADTYGVEVGALASYGLVNPPLTVSSDQSGDVLVGIQDSSFGATACGLFDAQLPQDYIDAQVAAGKGEYISPDGKVDASTCLFPETTWIIKNKHHDVVSAWCYLAERFTQYENYTVTNNPDNISRFLVVTKMNDSKGFANMTEENCADGEWLNVVEQEPTKETMLASLMRFLTTIFKFLTALFNGTLEF